MKESLKRSMSGVIYILIMWTCTSYSELSLSILFFIIGIISFYEMWKLRKGKTKILAFLFIFIPFIIIHFFGIINLALENNQFDSDIILFVFILTWTFDTFAYIFGLNFGKTKIMPSISPKKSWEGFIGGFAFTLISAYITSIYFIEIETVKAITISLFLPFTATAGDFTESYYKRKASVKDSGNFIPGHGGMLDRMDAFMITIPILYIYLNIN